MAYHFFAVKIVLIKCHRFIIQNTFATQTDEKSAFKCESHMPHIDRPDGPLDLKRARPVVQAEHQRRPPAVHVVHFAHQRVLRSHGDAFTQATALTSVASERTVQHTLCAPSRMRTARAADGAAGRCTRPSPARRASRTRCSSAETRWPQRTRRAPGSSLGAVGR